MADIPWVSSVRRAAQLTIDVSQVPGGQWRTAIDNAVSDLNSLFSNNRINVSLTVAESNLVVVALSSGSYTFQVDGVDHTGTLRTDVLHGATRGVDRVTRTREREKAYVFLPSRPSVNPRVRTSRTVGEPVMRIMAAHEFLHALGLDDHDPGFQGLLAGSWTLQEGNRASRDTVVPFGGSTALPPITFSTDTITRLNTMWP